MSDFINLLINVVWSKAFISLCLAVGIYFSFSTRFFQIRLLKDMMKLLFKSGDSEKSSDGVSSFQAFAIAISGRVGTGNIVGVATSIALGGPGSIFWMWVIAFFGTASAFVESVLAQIYKEKHDNEYRGGPAYYIEKALGLKWYALLFAFATVLAMGILLPGVQSNSIASAFSTAFNFNPYVTGTIITALIAVIIFGGVKRIGNFAQVIVPFMAIGYILIAGIIILVNINKLPAVLCLIFKSAFNLNSALGGMIGSAISFGVRRGIYSNEAGQGSGAQAAASAEVSHPVQQGLVQALSVYIVTFLICSASAFMILITDCFNVIAPNGEYLIKNLSTTETGGIFAQEAVQKTCNSLFPHLSTNFQFGSAFVAIALCFFAFTTLLAYYYYAETNVLYIYNGKYKHVLINILRFMLLSSIFLGSVKTANLTWALGDLGVGIMSWFNIVAIFILRKPAFKALKDYEKQKSTGIEPQFDPIALGIKNTEAWNFKKEKVTSGTSQTLEKIS